MIRRATRGIPAAMILAGGISRHGRSCWCRYCQPENEGIAAPPATQRQAIPVVDVQPAVRP